MATGPIPNSNPLATGPLSAVRKTAAAPATGLARAAASPIDRNMLKPVQSTLQATAVNLEAIAVPLDGADALSGMMEADRMRSKEAGLGLLGKGAAIINIGLQAKQLVKALGETPIAMDRVVGALVGIGVNLGEFFEKGLLGGVAGAANAYQGLMGAIDAVKKMKEEGANPSNVLEALSYATQSLGGVLGTLALACPPLAPALEPISIGLYLASGALSLAQLAYDHREWIKDKATKLWGALSEGVSSFARAVAAPPRAAPQGGAP